MRKDRFTMAREYVVSLFPAYQLADSFSTGINKVIGTNVSDFSAKFENHQVWWITSKKDWFNAHLAVIRCLTSRKNWLDTILDTTEKKGQKLTILSSQLSSGRLDRLTNKILSERYNKFVNANIEMYNFGLVCPLIDYQDKQYFSDYIYDLLKRKSKLNINENFSLITTATRLWPDKQQEIDLLLIYKKIIRSKKLCQTMKNETSSSIVELLSNSYSDICLAFKKHANKWAYLTYVYEGPSVGMEYYIDLMKDWIRFKKSPRSIVVGIRANRIELIKRQKKLISKLNLSDDEKRIISLAQKVAFVKPYRRLLQSEAYFNFEPVLLEVARRLSLSLRQVRFLLPEEVDACLRGGGVNTTLINHRIKFSVYLNKKGRRQILTGRSAQKHWSTVKQEKQHYRVNQIDGATAFPGKVKGKVVVVNMPEDMIKMEPGNILVSSATSPNLMPAIRKAGAIVTDEGGITCHAAIVSRELKIPCVIGTKIVTKILKDGDLVEVDANRAIVKIIK